VISFGFAILNRSEASLVLVTEILRLACGFAQADNLSAMYAEQS